ncbi:hypothetical protein RD792_007878 [Penstemon davidsonii]|uniref:RING-type domain-containing protein n=1 Tax=Penstemon davidsonii TaxID=160366 RepID=A0ABR0D8X5_9LAMI|nr:hypothetical protein RD792_007878 [Penstemon davidsonii]
MECLHRFCMECIDKSMRMVRNPRVVEHQVSYEEEEANGQGSSKDLSSTDERSTEVKSKEDKTLGDARTSQPSLEANAQVDSDDNDSETNIELLGAASGFLDSSEIPAWGSGGMSSDSRQCSPNESTHELLKNNRVSELTKSLLSACENYVLANTKK